MKIAIVELDRSHDECLYSQIKIIKSISGIHLTLICNKSLEENVNLFDLVDNKTFFTIRKGFKQWIDIIRIWRFCKKEGFEKIIFNTAQGKVISKLILFPFTKRTKFYGILHDTKKINSSQSQKIITKKIEHYFILSDYLIPNIKSSVSCSVFYPIFFPQYPSATVGKKEDEIWICVPGQVELKRRDYQTLFQSIEKFGVNENIKFVLLGRYGHLHGDGDYIKQQISHLNVQNTFLIWENFIPVPLFHSMLKNSDYILPLIHEDDKSGRLYNSQISGSFNLAVGYQKPLILEKNISDKYKLNEALTYNKSQLMNMINQIPQLDKRNFYKDVKWTFDFQRKRYLQSIGITLPNKN